MANAVKPVAVDLFCGAGGLSYGMQQVGIEIAGGIDLDPACKHPFETNVDSTFHQRDVAHLSSDFVESLFEDGSVRILAGCAPCQPFSSYSNRRLKKDEEWRLLSKFGELVTELKPDIVTMENVPRLRKYTIYGDFLSMLRKERYSINSGDKVVRCAEYGVPQNRRRLVVLASRHGEIELIPPTHSKSEFVTVRGAIEDLDAIQAGAAADSDRLHRSSSLSARNLQRIQSSNPGGTWRDWEEDLRTACHIRDSGKTYPSVYGRMEWDSPAPTITTQFHGYGNGRFGHPVQHRAISLREGALLQTFPPDYSFVPEGSDVRISTVAAMIGNAVPVKLGKAIGSSIRAHLDRLS